MSYDPEKHIMIYERCNEVVFFEETGHSYQCRSVMYHPQPHYFYDADENRVTWWIP